MSCHRLTPRRSFFPDWQTVGMPTCSSGPRFRPLWALRGIRFQCWHIFPLCQKRRVPLQHLPRGRTQWRMIRPEGIWPSRPNIKTCRCAIERVLDHRASFRLCGTTRFALLSRGFRLGQSIERPSHWEHGRDLRIVFSFESNLKSNRPYIPRKP